MIFTQKLHTNYISPDYNVNMIVYNEIKFIHENSFMLLVDINTVI